MTAQPETEDAAGPVQRRAARVVVVNAVGSVLLFQGCDPADPSAGTWWITPGGGLEAEESPAQGAARELAEETGLVVAPEQLGLPVYSRTAQFRFAGGHYRQSEQFFVLRVPRHDVDTAGFSALEASALLGHRWWSLTELRTTDELVFPEQLAELLARLAA